MFSPCSFAHVVETAMPAVMIAIDRRATSSYCTAVSEAKPTVAALCGLLAAHGLLDFVGQPVEVLI
jgi:hypothetical protein